MVFSFLSRKLSKKKRSNKKKQDHGKPVLEVLVPNGGSVVTAQTEGTEQAKSSSPLMGTKNRTSYELVAEEIFRIWNEHGPFDEILKHFASPDAPAVFEDGATMTIGQLFATFEDIFASFEDFQFNFGSIQQQRTKKKSEHPVVLIEDIEVTGTHTGKPHRIGPFPPPIPSAGTKVTLDKERVFLTFDTKRPAK